MPIASYQEMASASNWYPCPPSIIPFDFLDADELEQVTWTYRSVDVSEGYPDLIGVYLSAMALGMPELTRVILRQAGLTHATLTQAVVEEVATVG